MNNITDTLVLIKGAGDLASGVAARLYRCGFPVVMTELPHPLMVRRTVAFGEAVYEGEVVVEGITARRVEDVRRGPVWPSPRQVIPVLVDPQAALACAELAPAVLVDAVMAKRNTGTTIDGCAARHRARSRASPRASTATWWSKPTGGTVSGGSIYGGCAEPDTGRPGAGRRQDRRADPARAGRRPDGGSGDDRRPGRGGPGRGADRSGQRGACGNVGGAARPGAARRRSCPRARRSATWTLGRSRSTAISSRTRRWRSPAGCWRRS